VMGRYLDPKSRAVRLDIGGLYTLLSTPRRTAEQIVSDKKAEDDNHVDYIWRWALCHMLTHNRNYQERFRDMGRMVVAGTEADYQRIFGDRSMSSYYTGKCYALSYRFAQYIAQHGAGMAQEHARYLMGSEDVMIGRLIEKFEKDQVK
jgi:hypothetical protein